MNETRGKVTWLGHAAFLIETAEGTRVAIDPFIEQNPKFPRGFEYGKLDVVAATHGHFDHFGGDGVELAKKSGAMVVCVFELGLFCQSEGIDRVSGMNKGGAQTVAGVEFRMVQAVHSSGTTAAGKKNPPSDPCGFVLTLPDGFRIYHAGDTNVFSDMALIGELYRPDLALLPIGDFYTMGPREAAKACELLGAPRVIPMHWGTFPALTGTPSALREELSSRGLSTEVIELAPGGSWPR
ncbi:MAG: metal-dependent hydrolase [Acidobacteria bacterium]|nr:metal-dependent hydrolase [Acidobacteriota bacterium]MCA1609809.1 metal-dependent hydrolase [Acidobacteriota bacterium]